MHHLFPNTTHITLHPLHLPLPLHMPHPLLPSRHSLLEFFKKIRSWYDMANLPAEFRRRTLKLERNFAVSSVLYNKFRPIYDDIFADRQTDANNKPTRNKRKQRSDIVCVCDYVNMCVC